MKEAYVTFEVAKLLKENGFSIPSDTSYEDFLWQMYDENGKVHWGIYSGDWYFRITQQMAMCWLREEKGLHIVPDRTKNVVDENNPFFDYYCIIRDDNGNECFIDSIDLPAGQYYLTCEDAIEAALEYCLTNLI